jgi:hypothetical protein
VFLYTSSAHSSIPLATRIGTQNGQEGILAELFNYNNAQVKPSTAILEV